VQKYTSAVGRRLAAGPFSMPCFAGALPAVILSAALLTRFVFVSVHQHTAEDFARCRLRDLVYELQMTDALVGGDALRHPAHDGFGPGRARGVVRLQHDES